MTRDTATERDEGRDGWTSRVFVAGFLLVVAYSVLGFTVVPPLVRHAGFHRLSDQIDGTVRIECITFNPYTFSLTMLDCRVVGDERKVAASFWRLDADAGVLPSLFADASALRHELIGAFALHFDHGSAELAAESGPMIELLAAALDDDAGLRLTVVGQHDAEGDARERPDLARQRAEAVIAALAERHGIAADRLRSAVGEGGAQATFALAS